MNVFIERLKELRKENNLTTPKLGEILNVRTSTVTRWEKGVMYPSLQHLYQIGKKFNISVDYLLGLHDNKNICINETKGA